MARRRLTASRKPSGKSRCRWRDASCASGANASRLVVAALNPHASDGGLRRRRRSILAPSRTRSSGINVVGPLPSDTLFVQAALACSTASLRCIRSRSHAPVADGIARGEHHARFADRANASVCMAPRDIAGQGVAKPQSLLMRARVAAQQRSSGFRAVHHCSGTPVFPSVELDPNRPRS